MVNRAGQLEESRAAEATACQQVHTVIRHTDSYRLQRLFIRPALPCCTPTIPIPPHLFACRTHNGRFDEGDDERGVAENNTNDAKDEEVEN